MNLRRAAPVIAVALCLSACAAATPPPTTAPAPAGSQVGTPGAVLDQAREVADQLARREADLEAQIP